MGTRVKLCRGCLEPFREEAPVLGRVGMTSPRGLPLPGFFREQGGQLAGRAGEIDQAQIGPRILQQYLITKSLINMERPLESERQKVILGAGELHFARDGLIIGVRNVSLGHRSGLDTVDDLPGKLGVTLGRDVLGEYLVDLERVERGTAVADGVEMCKRRLNCRPAAVGQPA